MKTPAIYFSCYSPQKNERFPQTVIKINIIYYKIVLLSFFIDLNVIYFCCWPILLKSNLTKLSKNLFTCEKRTAGISLEGESGCARGGHRPGLYRPAARFRGLGTRLRIEVLREKFIFIFFILFMYIYIMTHCINLALNVKKKMRGFQIVWCLCFPTTFKAMVLSKYNSHVIFCILFLPV